MRKRIDMIYAFAHNSPQRIPNALNGPRRNRPASPKRETQGNAQPELQSGGREEAGVNGDLLSRQSHGCTRI